GGYGFQFSLAGLRPGDVLGRNDARRNPMAAALKRVTVAPKGMGLYDFVAHQEGFFAAEGLDVELDWKTFRGTQSSWKDLAYFQRPQDRPYTQDKREVIQGACVWGTICNASAGMGKVIEDTFKTLWWVPDHFEPEAVRGYLRALERAEQVMDADMAKYLPLWKLAVPAEFETYHPWDFARFGRGERFYYKTLPREEF